LEIVALEGLLSSSTKINIELWTERRVEIVQEYGPDGYILPYCWSAMENNRSVDRWNCWPVVDRWSPIYDGWTEIVDRWWLIYDQWTAAERWNRWTVVGIVGRMLIVGRSSVVGRMLSIGRQFTMD
jgi:hypothetical protein